MHRLSYRLQTQTFCVGSSILIFFFSYVLPKAIIALIDAYGPSPYKLKTKDMCRLCTVPLRTIMLLLAFALWILAAVLLGLTTGASDFCVNADNNVYDIVSPSGDASSNRYLNFFVSLWLRYKGS